MFDYAIKILPNNRILVRNNTNKTSETMKADQVSSFFENVLQDQLEAQKEHDAKVAEIKQQAVSK